MISIHVKPLLVICLVVTTFAITIAATSYPQVAEATLQRLCEIGDKTLINPGASACIPPQAKAPSVVPP